MSTLSPFFISGHSVGELYGQAYYHLRFLTPSPLRSYTGAKQLWTHNISTGKAFAERLLERCQSRFRECMLERNVNGQGP